MGAQAAAEVAVMRANGSRLVLLHTGEADPAGGVSIAAAATGCKGLEAASADPTQPSPTAVVSAAVAAVAAGAAAAEAAVAAEAAAAAMTHDVTLVSGRECGGSAPAGVATAAKFSVLRTASIRPPGIYGPGEQRHMPRVLRYARQGLFRYGISDLELLALGFDGSLSESLRL